MLTRRGVLAALGPEARGREPLILISANAEWGPTKRILAPKRIEKTPFGETFEAEVGGRRLRFLHGGWGKMAAAGSTQYAIDRYAPVGLINLGTCGGMEGVTRQGQVVLPSRTVVYDIYERMGSAEEAIAERACETAAGLKRGPFPAPVVVGPLVSADGDLDPAQVENLRKKYGAVAADWESGAIAWVAARNSVPVLILRAVSDVVGTSGGEAYQESGLFERRTEKIMKDLLVGLAAWCQFLLDRSREPR